MSGTASIDATAWTARLRADARQRFEVLGIPKPTEEDWRQTNVLPVASFAATVATAEALPPDWERRAPYTAAAVRVVLVNGRFDARASRLDTLPEGVSVTSLATALAAPDATLERTFSTAASVDDRAFVALNTALFVDGASITVAPDVEVSDPIHVVHVAVPGASPSAIHARTLIRAGRNSRLTVVESFVSAGETGYMTNAVTEVLLEPNARVEHVKIQDENRAAWHIATVACLQAKDARFGSHNVSLGGRLTRNDIGSRLGGEGAECHLYGLYLADGEQHVDNHTSLDHAAAHCPSWEMYKGVLSGGARAVFNGRIVVRPGAQKTDAKQSNKNLLLSDGALVHTRPQLEIYANDVKCTHGATIGRLDETSLFYLRTRGIGRDDARDILIHAFAGDVLDKIPAEDLRRRLAATLYERLDRDAAGALA
jgi:Fe-S cluster assembly protein SufD